MTVFGSKLTIVTPSYEKHFVQYCSMLNSIWTHCIDPDNLFIIVVVEKTNYALFDAFLATLPFRYEVLLTESVLETFSVPDQPSAFLKRVGKFTFQTAKKLGALMRARTEWSLVLDSEGLFLNDFSAAGILADYTAQKYVFYSQAAPRGSSWQRSLGFEVSQNAGEALSMDATHRWYMEIFHWFYETSKVHDLIARLGASFWETLNGQSQSPKSYFENVLYYAYLEKYHGEEYDFIDFVQTLKAELPPAISQRFRLEQLPFAFFGNDCLLSIVQPSEVGSLAPLFAKYKIPFIRLEPPVLSHTWFSELQRLPSLVATISSQHQIWLNKKVAICISGEFRQEHYGTPAQQVRAIKSFLSGVDCDVFVHSWANTSEALILHELQPRAYAFEERLCFDHLVRRIKVTEPNIKPGRNAGSLAMFYSLQRCFELMEPFQGDYDIVVRIRPDLYCDCSLAEVMLGISHEGDLLPTCIYMPKSFLSKGVNDQIAIGPIAKMDTYFRTFKYIEANIERLYFSPQSILLQNLLEHEVGIALVDLSYALMRYAPFHVGVIHAIMQKQEHHWWSRTSNLPALQDLTPYFTDKQRAMYSAGLGELPHRLYLPVAGRFARRFGDVLGVLEARFEDYEPSRHVGILWREEDGWRVSPYRLDDGRHEFEDAPVADVFCFRDGDDVVMSEWTRVGESLTNERLVFRADDLGTLVIPTETDIASAWSRRMAT